jgi:hypothetical protein
MRTSAKTPKKHIMLSAVLIITAVLAIVMSMTVHNAKANSVQLRASAGSNLSPTGTAMLSGTLSTAAVGTGLSIAEKAVVEVKHVEGEQRCLTH